jgi:hypothetical protein
LAWEHEPALSIRETTARPSAAVGGGVSAKDPVPRREKDGRCTCPKGMYNPQTAGRLQNLKLRMQIDIQTTHTTYRHTGRL